MEKVAEAIATSAPAATEAAPTQQPARGGKYNAQITAALQKFGAPLLAFIIFLVAWSLVASSIKVSFGSIPGPVATWKEAVNLWNAHLEERGKEKQFYIDLAGKKAAYLKKFPDRTYPARKYAGKPTIIDQVFTSIKTVFFGFMLASIIAIPVGILAGSSKWFNSAIAPFIQIFKPVSPLAWLPIVMILVSALYNPKDPMFEKAFLSSAITVAVCSLWPTLINTAVGVASIDKDHLNVARVLKLNAWTRVWKIIIPSALPFIFTGLRLSLGVGWMVLIAAEMLAQNPGLGKFIWDMYQNGSSSTLAQIFVAVFIIGIVGFLLDQLMVLLQRFVSFDGGASAH
ncbi:MAG TPA: ABC transporter permease [Chthoniobacterales bacterium]|jgi:nitrate/nitrite transport system permease protein